jgi:predicted SAM-dependent methyltransferase
MRTRLDRRTLASIYLRGHGIEIGALQFPLKVPRSAKVRYVDRLTVPDLRKHYPELNSYKLVKVDIVDDGETLGTIGDASQDFVIANHFLEHCENPIKAIMNFLRVLREGGILFLAIPDKRYTFDNKREVTSFDHLVRDYEEGPQGSRNKHLQDWVITVEGLKDEAGIQKRIEELDAINYSIHFHNWTQKEMLDLFNQLDERFGLPIEILLFMKHEGEVVFIIKKQSDRSPQ